jgi:2-polyprenyl-3-methyl-5-hydroxy-6-metoxy-1,4-benzoquinol methylase
MSAADQECKMNRQAMEPLALAMQAYLDGNTAAELIICRDDGQRSAVPAGYFFREAHEFSPLERAALARCQGHVLDAGAGSGSHSLALRRRGLPVTSLDISDLAVQIMKQRGLRDVHCGDVFDFQGGPFTTILLMGHGIGMVETMAGLNRFLSHARRLLTPNGCILLDSVDVRTTQDASHRAYHDANRRKERYMGEIRLRLEFQDRQGPLCGWLHVDPVTLAERAAANGWHCSVLLQQPSGDYLAQLSRLDTA